MLQLVKSLGGIIPDGDVDEAPLKAAIEDDLRDAWRVPRVLHELHYHKLLGLPCELLGEAYAVNRKPVGYGGGHHCRLSVSVSLVRPASDVKV